MNKRVLCLSVMAVACAGTAHAQPTVKVWGIVDLAVRHTNGGGVGSSTTLSNSGLNASQLGLRGTEDLGGGTRAGFWLEAGLNPDDGTGLATNVNNQPGARPAAPGTQGLTFNRRSYVSLAGGWGELRLGHDFTPTHYNSIYFDPFNANGVARTGAFTFSGATNAPMPTTITASNTISYWTPATLGGFYGLAMIGLGENISNAPNRRDGDFWSFRGGYAKGPLDVALATTRAQYLATTSIGDYTHSNMGASWNAGYAKFFALFNQARVALSTGTVRKNTVEVGVHIPVAPGRLIRVSYARLDDRTSATLLNADGSRRDTNDARLLGLGYVHELSKRTALYASYGRILNRGQATYAVTGGIAPRAGQNSTGYEFGLRHKF